MNQNSFTLGGSTGRLHRFRNAIQSCQQVANQISVKIAGLKSGPSMRRASFRDNESISNFIQHQYLYKGHVASEVLRSDEELKNIQVAYGEKDSFFGLMSEKDELMGTIGFKRFDNDSCELKKFHMKSGYTGQENAQQFLNYALDQAKALKYQKCLVRILPGEDDLQKFLMDCGFSKQSDREGLSIHHVVKLLK